MALIRLCRSILLFVDESVLLVINLFRSRRVFIFLGDETLELEGFSVMDLLSFGLRALASAAASRDGGTGAGTGGVVFGGFGPGVDGVDVQEDVDDWEGVC